MLENLCYEKDVVLVVDDDEMVAELIDGMMERGGCPRTSFNDPAEALEYYIEHSKKITLMITDLTMPILPGPELIRRAVQINPKLPIILMTDYAEEHIPDDVRPLVRRVLPKPFMKAEMFDAVRTALNKIDRQHVPN
jgi:CheY-like chemotaxis protein